MDNNKIRFEKNCMYDAHTFNLAFDLNNAKLLGTYNSYFDIIVKKVIYRFVIINNLYLCKEKYRANVLCDIYTSNIPAKSSEINLSEYERAKYY